MSPVAPMPQGAPVGTNGLKLWVMVDSGELSMTRVFPVVVAEPVFEPVAPELELLDEHAASPAASKPAAPTARSRLWLCILLIVLVFLSCGAVDGLSGGCTSGPPGNQLRDGNVQAPAGRAAGVSDGHQGRVLGPAAVLGQRAPGGERAAGRGHLPGQARLGRPQAPGAAGAPAAQDAAQVVRVGSRGDEQLRVRMGRLLGDLLGRAALDDLPGVH